ncbi:unnamed protein product [Anisakis simplex]|uniref:glutathione transferase n=1 Tax=Anisakis simplex TaxID=6269 RepID=A0A0M3KFB4_ANISI|nr:unnamed protein product [Anisakis simplex]
MAEQLVKQTFPKHLLKRVCVAQSSTVKHSHFYPNEMQNVSYRLIYFDLRYLAECARQIFRYKGVEFEDVRVRREDWPALKTSKYSIILRKTVLQMNHQISCVSFPETPFGKLPILEVNGEVISQSYAINRFLAHQFGLAGTSPFEEALVDSVADAHKDFLELSRDYFRLMIGIDKGDRVVLNFFAFISPTLCQWFSHLLLMIWQTTVNPLPPPLIQEHHDGIQHGSRPSLRSLRSSLLHSVMIA